MNRDTIVRVKVPMSLYESIKGKVLNEGKEKEEWILWGRKGESKDEIELGKYSDKAKAKKALDAKWDADTEHVYSDMGVKKKKELKEGEIELEEAKKPSAGMTQKEKSAVVKKAKAGKDIGKKGKGFEKVAAKAAKEYGSKEKGEKVAAAQMWKAQAKK